MKRYKTDKVNITIQLEKNDCDQKIWIIFNETDGKVSRRIDNEKFFIPLAVCKQNFNDSSFAKHVLNFFIKD